jgi:hypothetical protein
MTAKACDEREPDEREPDEREPDEREPLATAADEERRASMFRHRPLS